MRKRAKTWTIVVKGSDGREYTFEANVLGVILLSREGGSVGCEPGEISLPLDKTAIEELYHELMGILTEVKAEED